MSLETIKNKKLVEETKLKNEMKNDYENDLKSEKSYRISKNHEGCKCNEYNIWWNKIKSKREAYLFDINHVFSIDYSLYPIHEIESEGEEDESEEEEEYGPIRGMIAFVESLSETCRDTGRETSGNPSGSGKRKPYIGLLSNMEEENKIGGYLDSGANAHIFKTQNVFEQIDPRQTNIFTATETTHKNTASVGKTKNLKYDTGISTEIEKGIYCKNIVENLISVGKMCDNNHTIIFDKYGYGIYKGETTVRGMRVYAQNRNPQTGLYPIYFTTNTDVKEECTTEGKNILYNTFPNSSSKQKDENKNTVYFSDLNDLRQKNFSFVLWAQNICKNKERKFDNEQQQVDILDENKKHFCFLARFYMKDGMSDIERWHSKLGHVGTKIIKMCNINNLKIPRQPFRCEYCIKGKIHSGEHSTKPTGYKTDLKPGEYIITDLQGPYVRNRNGEKYTQIFIDVVSKQVWIVRLKKKTESDEAIQKTLLDSKTRSTNNIRVLRTDGDGIFGRSESFQKIKEKEKFIHERPAPYDHKQSSIIDRECRTLLEGVNTYLEQSGAPANFWGDAADHFVFTRNVLPRIKIDTIEGEKYKSPKSILENRDIHFNLKHLVAFGTQVTCLIPEKRREGKKTPGQKKCFDGIVIGYVLDMQAYIVWDIRERKKREISFFHCIVHEGFYPWRDKKLWSKEEMSLPETFIPMFEDILSPHEFEKYGFSEEEEKEIIRMYFPPSGKVQEERNCRQVF